MLSWIFYVPPVRFPMYSSFTGIHPFVEDVEHYERENLFSKTCKVDSYMYAYQHLNRSRWPHSWRFSCTILKQFVYNTFQSHQGHTYVFFFFFSCFPRQILISVVVERAVMQPITCYIYFALTLFPFSFFPAPPPPLPCEHRGRGWRSERSARSGWSTTTTTWSTRSSASAGTWRRSSRRGLTRTRYC